MNLRTLYSSYFFILITYGCSSAPQASKTPSPETPKNEVAEIKEERAEEEQQCKDGTCFECGENLCLPGSICISGQAGGSCVWLQECSPTPGCDCVLPLVSTDCTCVDGSGGPKLSCSSTAGQPN